MGRIHSFDQFTAVEVAYETTWGTVATSGFERLSPVTEPGETLGLQRAAQDTLQEFSSSVGVRTSYDYGRGWVAGELTMLPSYNSMALRMLLKELHGGFASTGDTTRLPSGNVPGGSPPIEFSTEFYVQNWFTAVTAGSEGGVGKGLTIRVWKSGPNDAGTIDRWVGIIVTGMRHNQPENQRPSVTFRFIGKQLSSLAATGLTPTPIQFNHFILGGTGADGAAAFDGTATPPGSSKAGSTYTLTRDVNYTTVTVSSGITLKIVGYKLYYTTSFTNAGTLYDNPGTLVPIRFRDLKNRTSQPVCPGIFKTGAALGNDANIRSFNFDVNGHIELDKAFITAPDTVLKPAHVAKWELTGEIVFSLEQDYGAAGKPHKEYFDGTASQLRLRYVSDSNVWDGGSEANRAPYAYDVWLQNLAWKSSKPNLGQLGNPPHPVTFEGYMGSYAAGQYCKAAQAQVGQWMIQTVVNGTVPI